MSVDKPGFGSFGRREDSPAGEQQMKPILHVGQVHAELHLDIPDEVLQAVGSKIGSMVASAVRQGFNAGFDAAMADQERREAELDPDLVRRATSG